MLYCNRQLYSSIIRHTTSKAIPQACLSTKCRFSGLSGTSTVRVTDFSSPIVGSGFILKCLISCVCCGGGGQGKKKKRSEIHFNFWKGSSVCVCLWIHSSLLYTAMILFAVFYLLLLLTLNRAKYISSSAILRPTQLLTPNPNGIEPKAFALTPWPRSHLSGKNLYGSGNVSSSWPMA